VPTDLPTLTEAARQVRAGSLTCEALATICLEQIEKFDDQVRAWVLVDPEGALEHARHCDQQLAAGEDEGPLHGMPIGIKDIIDVAGWPTKAGSPLRENHVAEEDAPIVASLRHAGAVILGKTVTVEFACFDPSPSRNPWNADHTPGGSSSGSAVAVAMRMCLGALGTQTGGSLVRPASYCGIATCKPTFGRVARSGIVPVSPHLDHAGPMARTVEDLRLLLASLPRSVDFAPPPVADSGAWDGSRPLQLGLVEDFFIEQSSAAIRTAVQDACKKLTSAGAGLTTVMLPDWFDGIVDRHSQIMAPDAAAYHRDQFLRHRDQYGPMITGLLDEGLAIPAADYAAALARQMDDRARCHSLFDGVDALIMPATEMTAPPTLATTGDKKFQAPWSYLGLPVVSLPCVLDEMGMPIAVQLVAPYHHDSRLLDIAEWCEEQFVFTDRSPILT